MDRIIILARLGILLDDARAKRAHRDAAALRRAIFALGGVA